MKPIMILATSRSRSSMIAAIVAAHGVFAGPNWKTKAGYWSFENATLKEYMKQRYGQLPDNDGKGNVFYETVHPFPDKLIPERRWMFKCAVNYAPVLAQLNPHWIYVKRDIEGTLKSYVEKTPFKVDQDKARRIITDRFRAMDFWQEQHGGTIVNTDDVHAGDFTSIEEALTDCGIAFSEDFAKGAITA